MAFEINITVPQKLFRGDSVDILCKVDGDLTGAKIRCEIFDDKGNNIKLANSTSGGSDTQVKITNGSGGLFTIYVPKNRTTSFKENSTIEIEIEDFNGKIQTTYKGKFKLESQKITWTTP